MLNLRSQLRRRVLTYFLANQRGRIYVRQLAHVLAVDSTNLSRELARLKRDGFLRAETEGRQLYYSVNPDYPQLKPVLAILQTTVGIEPTLKKAVQTVAGIESAWIFGSFAKGDADATSDIDLLIVGRPSQAILSQEIRKAEKLLLREVNYTVLSTAELKKRLDRNDPFLLDVWKGKRINLIHHGNDKAAKD